MKTQRKIQMLGNSFSIQSDESDAHLDEVLRHLSGKISEILEKNSGLEPIKIALLAALNVTDELISVKESLRHEERLSASAGDEIENITKKLIDKIDRVLIEEASHPSSKSE